MVEEKQFSFSFIYSIYIYTLYIRGGTIHVGYSYRTVTVRASRFGA